MPEKKRIFISSVQKEMELERAAVAQVISTDPFLSQHGEAVLYEKQMPTGRPEKKGYLELLKSCDIYALLVDVEYGRVAVDLSATHEEYRLAQTAKLPTLVFIRGLDNERDKARKPKTKEFFAEVKADGYKYLRFHDREDLKPGLRQALYAILRKEFGLEPSEVESTDGAHLIDAASGFESSPMSDVIVAALDESALADFVEKVIEEPGRRISDDAPEHALLLRGLALQQTGKPAIVTRAAYLLFAPHPANRFPQCEILADAYDEPRITGRPKGQFTINAPLVAAVRQALKFVDDHTFHPRRVVGLNNVRLDEYPDRALREALVNAVVHRNYDDATRKICLRVFSDRVEIASPGYPLKPLTLAKLKRGNYRACSRNPLIAQTLASLDLMEQRGTGFARMQHAMLDHGLDALAFAEQDGYFVVTFAGPAGNYERLKTPATAGGPVTPAIETQLNERQRDMVVRLARGEELTSKESRVRYGVSAQALHRDFQKLVALSVAELVGSGRTARYVLKTRSQSHP